MANRGKQVVRPSRWAKLAWAAVAAPLLLLGMQPATLRAQAPRPVDFGREIQPLLAKRCYSCHGPDKQKGGLRLDQQEAAFAALDSGDKAIVAGDIKKSVLLDRVSSTEEGERMPPEGAPLSATQIDLLRRWISGGAKWQTHWAFNPMKAQTPPTVKDQAWVRNPIDSFILGKLEASGLAPAAPADKVALLRRATFNLIGLPPTPAEVQAFLDDNSPEAYEKVIDRLLASPHYGEHWARHWLDLVRYADTNSFERDGVKPNAWRYRDYVIRALNDDKPYDQFVKEQLAGDELPQVTADSLIATGYYRLGLWDDEPADRELAKFDTLDDIVATTGQVFLGLTVNCARCHDHKIDPIPQRDYYSLLSFFHNVTPMSYGGPNVERPVFANEAARQGFEVLTQQLHERRNEAQAELTRLENSLREKYAARTANPGATRSVDIADLEYKFYRSHWEKLPDFDNLKPEGTGKLSDGLFDIRPATREDDFGFVFTGQLIVPRDGRYTFRLDSDDGSRLLLDGKKLVERDGVHGTGDPQTAEIELKQGRLPIRLEYFQGIFGKGLIVQWSGPGVETRSLAALPQANKATAENLADLIRTQGAQLFGAAAVKEYNDLKEKLEQLRREKVPADYALVISEHGPRAPETFVMQRGNAHVPGDKVEPAYPQIFASPKPSEFQPRDHSSGRRIALAEWITSPTNRLTARVMVNRLWQHHFGRGIVRSTNNFGQLGDAPTHPELLDWLAMEFASSGWKIKQLHKLIMLSNAYQMSSAANEAALRQDPQNDLFWRFDMRRLTAEELRDAIHAVNGRLHSTMYGPGFYPDISDEVKAGQSVPGSGWGKTPYEEQARRSVYIHVKRSLITPILADFDFADTDSSCAARFATTQPTQALGMLNGAFLNQQAAELANRLRKEAGPDRVAQIKLALQLAVNREPEASAIERGVKLMDTLKAKHNLSEEQALNLYCLLVYNLNEFVYLD